MSNIQIFDNWFDKLPQSEQEKLITHIIGSRLEMVMEGYNVGPAGQRLLKGLFVGPAGLAADVRCSSCGKPL